ncbi:MAG: type II secretion system protein N, partial [Lysobacterales bacterium]
MLETRLKHLPSAPWLLLLLLAALCLWLALRLAATVLDAGARDQPVAGMTAAVPELRSLSRGSLAGWHLFGSVLTPVDHRRPVDDLPDSSVDLTVAGILAGTGTDSGAEAGFALIADAAGQQQAYRIGDTLPGGARVLQIHADRVVVRHNGRDENLRLPWQDTSAVVSPSARPGGSGAAGL